MNLSYVWWHKDLHLKTNHSQLKQLSHPVWKSRYVCFENSTKVFICTQHLHLKLCLCLSPLLFFISHVLSMCSAFTVWSIAELWLPIWSIAQLWLAVWSVAELWLTVRSVAVLWLAVRFIAELWLAGLFPRLPCHLIYRGFPAFAATKSNEKIEESLNYNLFVQYASKMLPKIH